MAMTLALLLFAANVAAITIVTLVAASYLIAQPRAFNARIFALVSLSTVAYLVARTGYAFGPDLKFDLWPIWPVLGVVMNTGSGFWMILCHALFQDSKRFPRWLLWAFVAQVCLSGAGNLYPALAYSGGAPGFVLATLPLVLQTLFSITALYWIVRGWRADLLEARRLLRWVFLGVLGGLYLGINTTETLLIGAAPATRLPWDNAITVVIATTAVVLALVSLRFDAGIIFRVASRVSATTPLPGDEQQEADLQRFYRIFRDDKSYLEPGLSVAALAGKLAMPQYRLRALINRRLGYRNFNALLHEYRIEDACRMLADPDRNDLPILTIALTVGYQSIAPFNQAFRERKGVTPSVFRQQSQHPGTS